MNLHTRSTEEPGNGAVSTEQPAAGGGEAEQKKPIEQLLAKANAEKGASVAKKCLACHDFTKGGPNQVGTTLYGVGEVEGASHEGCSSTDAMRVKGGKWTIPELRTCLGSPRAFVPGTSMDFAGSAKGSDRADRLA